MLNTSIMNHAEKTDERIEQIPHCALQIESA